MSALSPQAVHGVLNRYVTADPMPLVLDLQKSNGCYLHDARSGRDLLDFFGFYASRAVGFRHPKLMTPGFQAALLDAALCKPSNCDVFTQAYASFVEKFAQVALAGQFPHLFFVEGGGAAVDNAVKAAIDWKIRSNLAAHRQPGQPGIAHFRQCFHGRTGYALSMTDSHDVRKTLHFPKFSWPRLPNPKLIFPLEVGHEEQVAKAEQQSLQALQHLIEQSPHQLAGILIEPIQGEGGDNYFRSQFLQQLQKMAHQAEALFMLDEVQTGFGGTGKWWDYLYHDISPDVLVFGKKTQVCGIAGSARFDSVESVFHQRSRISSTFAGNLADMVRAERYIDIIVEDDLLDNTVTMGQYMQHILQDLMGSFSMLKAPRGRGSWNAFDAPTPGIRDKILQACFEQALLVLPCGTHSIRFRPALDVDVDAVGRAGAQLAAALQKLKKRGDLEVPAGLA